MKVWFNSLFFYGNLTGKYVLFVISDLGHDLGLDLGWVT